MTSSATPSIWPCAAAPARRTSRAEGASPFGSGPVFSSEVPDLPEWDKKDKLAYERDMLGLYVSDHPLLGLEGLLGKLSDTEISDLISNEERPDGAMVTVAGLIT